MFQQVSSRFIQSQSHRGFSTYSTVVFIPHNDDLSWFQICCWCQQTERRSDQSVSHWIMFYQVVICLVCELIICTVTGQIQVESSIKWKY